MSGLVIIVQLRRGKMRCGVTVTNHKRLVFSKNK